MLIETKYNHYKEPFEWDRFKINGYYKSLIYRFRDNKLYKRALLGPSLYKFIDELKRMGIGE